MANAQRSHNQCVVPTCTRPKSNHGYSRGLCVPCYSKAKKAVDVGETTWEELESLGLALPDDDTFTAALKKAKGVQ